MTPLWTYALVIVLLQHLAETQAEDDSSIIWATLDNGVVPSDLVTAFGIPATSTATLPLTPLQFSNETYANVTSVTFHYLQGLIYCSDARSQTVFRFETREPKEEVFHRGFSQSIKIAMDWSVGNLYWVDWFYEWVAFKPTSSVDIFDFKVLFDAGVELPTAITVDPVRKYVFWSETGTTPRIRRVQLDGSEPEVVAVGSIYQPNSLTLDPQTGKIFWSDLFKESLEHCNADGTQRGVDLKVGGFSFTGISYYQTTIFGTSESDQKRILGIQENTGVLKTQMDVGKYGSPRAITVYARELQENVTDTCLPENCSHFCVRGSFGEGKCMCQDGFTLQPDGRSCSGRIYSPRLLTFANKTHVCVMNVTTVQGLVPLNVVCLVVSGSNITAIAPDARNRLLYYSDRDEMRISRVSLDTGIDNIVVNNAGRIEGIAFDWLKNAIYWTDSADKEIKSFLIGSGEEGTILKTNDNFGQIAVDPYTEKLFWITYNPVRIRSVGLDGRGETTLVSTSVTSPGDLYCDPLRQIIYWSDDGYIRSVHENGTNQRVTIATAAGKNRAILVYKGYFIWTSSSPSYINSGNRVHQRHSRRIPLPIAGDLIDINIIDTGVQRENRGPCFNNGGCDHYCLSKAVTRECRCELGFVLQTDKQTCSRETLRKNFILVSDGLAKRFYQVDLTTHEVVGTGVTGIESLSSVDINPATLKLYWSQPNQRAIMAAEINGSSEVKVIDTGTNRAERLAIDSATGNIYYTAGYPDWKTNHTMSYIAVVSPDGKNRKTLVSGITNIRAIQLYSSAGIMFWSQYDFNPRLERANMDGSARRAIVTTDIRWPNGIAIDHQADVLYWTDGYRDVIERCTLYGADRVVIHEDRAAHIMAVSLHDDQLYYTAWNRRGVSVVDKADGSNLRILTESPLFVRLDDIAVFGPLSQFPANTNCRENNGQCSTFCLPTDVGHSCACSDRVELLPDSMTCKGVRLCSEVPYGGFMGSCNRYPGVTCTPVCHNDYMASVERVVCNNGTWSTPAAGICVYIPVEDHPSPSLANSTTIIAAGIASAAVIVVVVIIILTLIYLRQRNRRTPVTTNTVIYTSEVNNVNIDNIYSSLDEGAMGPPTYDPPPYSPKLPIRDEPEPDYIHPSGEHKPDPTYLHPKSLSSNETGDAGYIELN